MTPATTAGGSCLEGERLVSRYFGQDLAVQPNVLLLQPKNELGVLELRHQKVLKNMNCFEGGAPVFEGAAHPVEACGGVDLLNPEGARVTLAHAAIPV